MLKRFSDSTIFICICFCIIVNVNTKRVIFELTSKIKRKHVSKKSSNDEAEEGAASGEPDCPEPQKVPKTGIAFLTSARRAFKLSFRFIFISKPLPLQ